VIPSPEEVLERWIETVKPPPAINNLTEGPDRGHKDTEEGQYPYQRD